MTRRGRAASVIRESNKYAEFLKGSTSNQYVLHMTNLSVHHGTAWQRSLGLVPEVSSELMAIDRFRILYDQLYDDLWRYCQRRSSSHEQATDVLSETMLVMWERIDDIPPGTGARPWLFGVARNQLRKRHETTSRVDRLVERLKLEYSSRRTPSDPAEEANAHSVLETLRELPEDDQELLRLQAWEGLTHSEIGQMFGVTENAVAIRVHRARQRFAALLAEGEE